MRVEIRHCNNVSEGFIEILENSLNIKYAINGTGKTSLSKAIQLYVSDKENGTQTLGTLLPFKFAQSKTVSPEVIGCETLKSVMVFNEKYLDECVFQEDELLKGSFEILIRGPEYENGINEIETQVKVIKEMLEQDKDIDSLILDFSELDASFGKPAKNGIHASSILSKAFKTGNKVAHIPDDLEGYRGFITHQENFKWIRWQIEGKSYLDIDQNCPYCISDIKEKRHTIERVGEVYDSKSVENLNKIVSVFGRLNQYFSDSTRAIIDGFITNINGYTDDQVNFLREVRTQLINLKAKFISAKNIGFTALKEVDKVIDLLRDHHIDLTLFGHFNSTETQKKAAIINDSFAAILEKAGELQGKVNRQKILIERLISENKEEINGFLKNAGFTYRVDITPEQDGSYKLKLIHNDISDEIKGVNTTLSFGERNAFSLVLFMYDVLKKQPDLIILDDPISSFDKNKKFAIIDMLFLKEKSLRNKTVLLLTHDIEPLVDMLFHHRGRFSLPTAAFLENIDGRLSEKPVEKHCIKTYLEICKENISAATHIINKMVYLRRLFEIGTNKGMGYQVLSSLFHKRPAPLVKEADSLRNISAPELTTAEAEIKDYLPDFDYTALHTLMVNDEKMKELYHNSLNNYEKLHIYRMIFDDKPETVKDTIIQKFVNQSFHIENDYIYQLNPRDFQLVPQYIISECDQKIASL